ncbi:MAG: MBL fold metallo-hydrolase [Dehalococcoides mccartyi]|uniref:MBL fold metallo-hydrolase n=1 Tax=Dehalococcoides mccartyi TaxID=61435 RepID=UPI0030F657E3
MEIVFLGAHNCETKTTRPSCLMLSGGVVLDAGAITSSLTLDELYELRAVILSHAHYDHIKDVPLLAMNLAYGLKSVDIYGSRAVQEVVTQPPFSGGFYPDFFTRPPSAPALRFHEITPGLEFSCENYQILPLSVPHSRDTTGFLVKDAGGHSFFYTSDTGSGLGDVWQQISPELLIIELTMPNRLTELALSSKHLSPELLETELRLFRELKGYLPRIVTLHTTPLFEAEIKTEIQAVAERLHTDILMASEGLKLWLGE